jgi:hypothetical protein
MTYKTSVKRHKRSQDKAQMDKKTEFCTGCTYFAEDKHGRELDVEAKVHHIPILDNIILAFES